MEYDVKLNVDEVTLVLNALSELPLKDSLAAYMKIRQQMAEQDIKRNAPNNQGTRIS